MEIRQATNFLEVLELQKILDSKVKSCRERDLTDIKLSIIAEIIEFNEECIRATHKTWKTRDKVFSIEKAKKEAIDILFFLAQLINYYGDVFIRKNMAERIKRQFEKKAPSMSYLKNNTMGLLELVCEVDFFEGYTPVVEVLDRLIKIYKMLGMTEEEMYKRHFDKWKENYYDRIGNEWN